MTNLINRLVREEDGQDLVEYALLVSLIALVVATAIRPIGEAIQAIFQRVPGAINGGSAPSS